MARTATNGSKRARKSDQMASLKKVGAANLALWAKIVNETGKSIDEITAMLTEPPRPGMLSSCWAELEPQTRLALHAFFGTPAEPSMN